MRGRARRFNPAPAVPPHGAGNQCIAPQLSRGPRRGGAQRGRVAAPVVQLPLGFSGAVLAGGNSTRMGRDKAGLALADGETLLHRTVALLRAAGAAEVLVSVRAGQTRGVPGTREIPDELPDAGPLAGLAAVLGASAQPQVLVLAVDLARMTPEFLRELRARAATGRGVVPVDARGVQPLAAVYPAAAAESARRALADGRRSLRAWAEELARAGLVELWPVPAAAAGALANCNTPEDWAALERG